LAKKTRMLRNGTSYVLENEGDAFFFVVEGLIGIAVRLRSGLWRRPNMFSSSKCSIARKLLLPLLLNYFFKPNSTLCGELERILHSPSDGSTGESLIPVIAPRVMIVHCAGALFRKHSPLI
jgi:hypothetical protein